MRSIIGGDISGREKESKKEEGEKQLPVDFKIIICLIGITAKLIRHTVSGMVDL